MIKCHLSRIMGERRINIADLARMTQVNRGTITRLYNEEAVRVELDVVNVLCKTLEISVSELFEYIKDIDERD